MLKLNSFKKLYIGLLMQPILIELLKISLLILIVFFFISLENSSINYAGYYLNEGNFTRFHYNDEIYKELTPKSEEELKNQEWKSDDYALLALVCFIGVLMIIKYNLKD